MEAGGDFPADGGFPAAGLPGDQTDPAQLQQVFQTDFGLGQGAGGEQRLGLQGLVEGEVGEGEVFAVHRAYSGSSRSFSGEGAGSAAGAAGRKVAEGRSRLTEQLA